MTSTSQIVPPVPKTYPPKPVPNPFDSNYEYTNAPRQIADPNWGTVYDVKTLNYDKGDSSVDVIAINTDKNSIGIMEAWNKYDAPADATKKLALADIEMNLFTSAGKTPQDLQLIHVDNVENSETRTAIVSVYGMMKESTLAGNTITLRATGTGSELDGYNTLAGTPFGLGADKVRQQFSVGKTITQYTLYRHNDGNGAPVNGAFDSKLPFSLFPLLIIATLSIHIPSSKLVFFAQNIILICCSGYHIRLDRKRGRFEY